MWHRSPEAQMEVRAGRRGVEAISPQVLVADTPGACSSERRGSGEVQASLKGAWGG